MLRIRKIRKMRNMSGVEVAAKLGISPQYYYDLEKGKKKLSVDIAIKLSRIYRVPLDFLLGEVKNYNGPLLLSDDSYADGYTDQSYLDELEETLKRIPESELDEEEQFYLTDEEKDLVLLFRQTEKEIPEEERQKLRNTIADTIELYLARTKKKK